MVGLSGFQCHCGARTVTPITEDGSIGEDGSQNDGWDAFESIDPPLDDGGSLPQHCVGNWPEEPVTDPKPALNTGDPRVLWKKSIGVMGLSPASLAMTTERLTIRAGNILVLFDKDGNEKGRFQDKAAHWMIGGPVADREGNFLVSSFNLYKVDKDGNGIGQFPLSANQSTQYEHTVTSNLVLSPADILYFSATDGYFYAYDHKARELVWKKPRPKPKYETDRNTLSGVGDTIYVDNEPFSILNGEKVGQQPVVDVRPVSFTPTYIGLKASYAEQMDPQTVSVRSFLLNHCGIQLWSLPNTNGESWAFRLSTYRGVQPVLSYKSNDPGATMRVSLYSSTGKELLSPKAIYAPLLVTADGNFISRNCNGTKAEYISYSSLLVELWRLEIGEPCDWTFTQEILDDSGILYVVREQPQIGITITAVQTPHPGLAYTMSSRRTNWLE